MIGSLSSLPLLSPVHTQSSSLLSLATSSQTISHPLPGLAWCTILPFPYSSSSSSSSSLFSSSLHILSFPPAPPLLSSLLFSASPHMSFHPLPPLLPSLLLFLSVPLTYLLYAPTPFSFLPLTFLNPPFCPPRSGLGSQGGWEWTLQGTQVQAGSPCLHRWHQREMWGHHPHCSPLHQQSCSPVLSRWVFTLTIRPSQPPPSLLLGSVSLSY